MNTPDQDWIAELTGSAYGVGLEDDKPDALVNFEMNVSNQDAGGDDDIDDDYDDDDVDDDAATEEDIDIAEGEVDDAAETVEKLEETQDTLEKVEISLETALYDDKGITPRELDLIRIALESNGINLNAMMLPSNERFSAGRYEPSVEVLRKIKSAGKTVFGAVRKAAMKAITKLKEWWHTSVSRAAVLKKNADENIRIARSRGGDPVQNSFNMKGVNNIGDQNGKAYPAKEAIKKLELMKEIADLAFNLNASTSDKWIEKMDKELDGFINTMRESVEYMKGATENFTYAIENDEAPEEYTPRTRFERFWGDIEKNVSDKTNSHKVFTKNVDPRDTRFSRYDAKQSDVLPGGYILVNYNGFSGSTVGKNATVSTNRIRDHFTSHCMQLETYSTKKSKKKTKGDVDTLSLDQVIKISELVKQIAAQVANSAVSWNKRFQWFETVDNRYKAKLKEVESDPIFKLSKPHTKAVQEYVKGITDYHRRRVDCGAQVASYLVRTCGSFNFWCRRSNAQYGTAVGSND